MRICNKVVCKERASQQSRWKRYRGDKKVDVEVNTRSFQQEEVE
jgi:hypothetical protein